MADAVGIKFKQAGKIYYFDRNGLRLFSDDRVIVETDRGIAIGIVVEVDPGREKLNETGNVLKKIMRLADDDDIKKLHKNCALEKEAFNVCRKRIKDFGLQMKLTRVEYYFEGSKAVFFFTAEKRVDFRELVRDLARRLGIRIEMRQIGVRDEAKLLGGIGSCGKMLCCSTCLREFEPVSVRMAKIQNITLNPSKISGVCGRLMCCLVYEHETYRKLKKNLPRRGARVSTPLGTGTVIKQNIMEQKVTVQLETGENAVVMVEDLKKAKVEHEEKKPPAGPKGKPVKQKNERQKKNTGRKKNRGG
ncbi:stage 0 sporulation family protein [Thermodesulfobacteriota bacterium]